MAENEDNDVLLFKIGLNREAKDLDLHIVSSGSSAIAYLSSIPTSGDGNPALLITAIKMAPGDGFFLLEWVRASPRWNQLPVIVLTYSAVDEDRKRAENLGATAYYVKGSMSETHKLIRDLRRWL